MSRRGQKQWGGVCAVREDQVDGNKTYLQIEYCLTRKDGSTIHTKDEAVLTAVPGEQRLLASATYPVARTTGAFEGMQGEFRSWGSLDPTTGHGCASGARSGRRPDRAEAHDECRRVPLSGMVGAMVGCRHEPGSCADAGASCRRNGTSSRLHVVHRPRP